MKIVLLNGPAGSGKDTAADLLKKEFSGHIVKFAAPLKAAAAGLCFNGNRAMFDEFDLDQAKKVEPRPEFFGVSCRQVQIDISEKFIKPVYGEDAFGKICAQRIIQMSNLGEDGPFFVSDSGFVPEAEVLIRAFGPESVSLIRILRPGHDFSGDSRGYVQLAHLGIKEFDVLNDGDLEQFKTKLIETASQIL